MSSVTTNASHSFWKVIPGFHLLGSSVAPRGSLIRNVLSNFPFALANATCRFDNWRPSCFVRAHTHTVLCSLGCLMILLSAPYFLAQSLFWTSVTSLFCPAVREEERAARRHWKTSLLQSEGWLFWRVKWKDGQNAAICAWGSISPVRRKLLCSAGFFFNQARWIKGCGDTFFFLLKNTLSQTIIPSASSKKKRNKIPNASLSSMFMQQKFLHRNYPHQFARRCCTRGQLKWKAFNWGWMPPWPSLHIKHRNPFRLF